MGKHLTRLQARSLGVATVLLLFAVVLLLRLSALTSHTAELTAAAGSRRYTLTVPAGDGVIYDRNLNPLTGKTTILRAVVNPTPEAAARLRGHLEDSGQLDSALQTGKPFVCTVDSAEVACEDVTVFEVPVRYDGTAVQLLGYCNGDGAGVCGLEAAYNDLLRGAAAVNRVVYSMDGQGELLDGVTAQVTTAQPVRAGVVTTLDAQIQQICEEAVDFTCGAVVVLDVQSGAIRAMVSAPTYDPTNVAAALNAENAPFLNRALCAYGVGSVFKIVTAASALEAGVQPSFAHCCTGSVPVCGRVFHCHNRAGHGWQEMSDAMSGSCNCYFVTLSRLLSAGRLRVTAARLGFGAALPLTEGITSAAGVLPATEALEIPAERANFSFGQGALTATPLQVARMTAAVAADGWLPSVSLVRGLTADGNSLTAAETVREGKRVLSASVAAELQTLLKAAVDGNEQSAARPANLAAAGKTSTAQTGRYGADGEELCHAWMTGFFPADAPQYAVTVLVEDGGSGNTAAAPVFRRIAEEMAAAGLVRN